VIAPANDLRRLHTRTEQAFFEHADFPSSVNAVISEKKLVQFVKSKQPKMMWRLTKCFGIVYFRYIMRRYCLPARCGKCIPGTEFLCLGVSIACWIFPLAVWLAWISAAYPGDKDWRAPASAAIAPAPASGLHRTVAEM